MMILSHDPPTSIYRWWFCHMTHQHRYIDDGFITWPHQHRYIDDRLVTWPTNSDIWMMVLSHDPPTSIYRWWFCHMTTNIDAESFLFTKQASFKYKFWSGVCKEKTHVEIIHFLDVKIILLPSGKIETNLYYKPTNNPWLPQFPQPHKIKCAIQPLKAHHRLYYKPSQRTTLLLLLLLLLLLIR